MAKVFFEERIFRSAEDSAASKAWYDAKAELVNDLITNEAAEKIFSW